MIDRVPPKRRRRDEYEPEYGKLPRPTCPEHGVMLVIRSTRPDVRYLYCPVPGCRESKCLPRTSPS